ncbi:methionyl-tRNA formyltransferase [Halarchaeum sp. P4]|uniref:methionyl-tRNA formyltransferase n=1 Tax=Halarchaeum sp. P4 TaxID=3421639 RepID=UPI003EB77A7F
MIRIAFFGSHDLGVACLDRLRAHEDVSVDLVVTYAADADTWWDASVREYAESHLDCPVLPLAREAEVLDYDIDYLLSVYHTNVLGPELLDHPDEAALNLHQAELPRYRGSNVFSHAIMNAREDDYWQYGTTFHVMAEDVDAGDVVARSFVDITEDDTSRSLYEKTTEASIELFEDALPLLVERRVADARTPQTAFDGPRYFYSKDSLDGTKEIPAERLGDPAHADAVYDRIRALDFPPHEPAYTRLDGRKVHLTTGRHGD